MKEGRGKKGQVTLFVIIALVIIVFGVIAYFFYPGIRSTNSGIEENPRIYMQNCVEDTLEENVELISSQGGSIKPNSNFSYGGNPIEYLCYSNQNFQPCVPQIALLINHIENEIEISIEDKVEDCLNQMERDYKIKGYEILLTKGNIDTTLVPNKIVLTTNSRLK